MRYAVFFRVLWKNLHKIIAGIGNSVFLRIFWTCKRGKCIRDPEFYERVQSISR